MLLAASLVASACAEIGEPYLGEGVSAPSTTVAEVESTEEQPAEEEVVSANVSAVFSPPRPDGYVPAVLASLGTRLVVAENDAITDLGTRFPAGVTERVVDDYLGGLVAQLDSGVVQWLPADGATPTLITNGDGGLLDVGFIDDTLAVQLFVEVPGGIDQIKLVDGEREAFTRFTEGAFVVAFSASNGIQAVALGDDQCGALAFFNTSGQRVDLGGPPEPACPVPRRPNFGAVAMSPGGDAVAYTEVTYREDGLPAATTLTILELATGNVVFEGDVGSPGEQIDSLSYDGRRLVFMRTGEQGREVGLIDVAAQTALVVEGLEGVQGVTFARLPLLLADPAEADQEAAGDDPAAADEN